MGLSLRDFWSLGREQWHVQSFGPARVFTRVVGPLGMHARIRNAHVLQLLGRLALPSDAHLLDAGCGHAYATFWLAQRFPTFHLAAIESDPALIAANQQIAARLGLANVEFQHQDLQTLDRQATYDAIFSIDVLEHIPDDLAVLRRFHRALKPEGVLLLHLPLDHKKQWRAFRAFRNHTIEDHVRDEYTLDEISAKLYEAGFSLWWHQWGFSPPGELAFELNQLCWKQPWLRNLLAMVTFPLSFLLAYLDLRTRPRRGNSLLVVARSGGEVDHVPTG